MDEQVKDTLLERIGALAPPDVSSTRREGIRRQCHAVLRRRRSSSPVRTRIMACVLEPALATALAVFYVLGVVERAFLLLGG